MATATQTDDELIILEDDTSVSNEDVIDFNQSETSENIVLEETPVSNELNLDAIADTKDSPEIINLGETLEETSDASDLFSFDSVESETPEATTSEATIDLFADETATTEEATVSLDESAVVETPEVDLFGEAEVTDEVPVESSLLEVEETMEFVDESDAGEVESEVSLLEDNIAVEETSLEANLLEDESSIFGGDDSSAQDDSTTGDDTAVTDESMDSILAGTIAKLATRKAHIIEEKDTDKAQIKNRKAQIKELEAEIAEFDITIRELGNEQRKITNNIKSLETMKLKA